MKISKDLYWLTSHFSRDGKPIRLLWQIPHDPISGGFSTDLLSHAWQACHVDV